MITDKAVRAFKDVFHGERPMSYDEIIRAGLAAALQAHSSAEAQQVNDLPWRTADIQRGLILFRTSNNAHGFINVSILSERVDNLTDAAKTELANMMRNIAHQITPTKPESPNNKIT